MKYKKETLKNKKVQFSIELTKEEWNSQVDHAYEHEKGKYSVQGFRKGKAPRKVLEKMYGEGVFYEEALNMAFYKYYGEVLNKEKDLEPVGNPSLDVKKIDKDGAIIIVQVDVKPEVKLGEYKGITIEKVDNTVTKEQIEAELALVQDKASRLVEVDRPVKDKDTVTIDFSGSIDGVKFEGGTAENYDLVIGSGSFIPGFEEQIIGMKKGEQKDVKVKFPENYHAENLKGKESVFDVKVHVIREKQMPELNDELAKNMSEFETLKEWKDDIKKSLQQKEEEKAKIEVENKLIQTISDNSTVEIPESMVEEQISAFIKEFEYRLMYQGLKLEDYAKMTNTTVEEIRKSRREDAIKTVKTRLVLEAIIKAEKIDVDEKELKAKLKELSTKENKPVEEFEKTLTEERANYIVNDLMVNKLLNYLRENNNI